MICCMIETLSIKQSVGTAWELNSLEPSLQFLLLTNPFTLTLYRFLTKGSTQSGCQEKAATIGPGEANTFLLNTCCCCVSLGGTAWTEDGGGRRVSERLLPSPEPLVGDGCWVLDSRGQGNNHHRNNSGRKAPRSREQCLPPQCCFIGGEWGGDNKAMGCFLWVVPGNVSLLYNFIFYRVPKTPTVLCDSRH